MNKIDRDPCLPRAHAPVRRRRQWIHQIRQMPSPAREIKLGKRAGMADGAGAVLIGDQGRLHSHQRR